MCERGWEASKLLSHIISSVSHNENALWYFGPWTMAHVHMGREKLESEWY